MKSFPLGPAWNLLQETPEQLMDLSVILMLKVEENGR